MPDDDNLSPEIETIADREPFLGKLPNTKRLDPSQHAPAERDNPLLAQPISAERQGLLRLEWLDLAYDAILIPIKQNILIGRPDPLTNTRPDIDLTDYSGYKMGVSRRHAEIHWHHDHMLMLYDLGSSNGTYLNGERLKVNMGVTLYNGDIIHLGEIGFYIYYEIQTEETFIPFRREDQ